MKHLTLFICCFVFLNLYSQQTEKCATVHYIDFLEQQHPGFKQAVENTFNQALVHSQQIQQYKSTNSAPDTIYRIPVVFHVVYNTPQQNLSDAIILDQLAVMNEDFRRMNADTTNTRAIFKARAGDVGFEFFLATIDPNGNPTNGITRTQTTVSSFNTGFLSTQEMDQVKKTSTGGIDAWNTSEYMNIWICNLENGFLGDALLGYSYPPIAAPNWPSGSTPVDSTLWGLNIHYKVVGRNNPNLPAALASFSGEGRTVTHEAGHYWGLRHIWGDSGDPFTGAPDCDITQDDGFSDTPHMGSNSQQEGCSFSKNTCTNGEVPDEPDMVENYMDYSTEDCQNMFTQQQANLMRSMAVIGRPNLPIVIIDETFTISEGEWVVVNGTDTFQITSSTVINLEAGDQIMFLNENNGYNYTVTTTSATTTGTFNASTTSEGTVNFGVTSIKDYYANNIQVFPNPSNGQISCTNLAELKINTISIYNMLGEQLKTYKVTNQNQTILDLSVFNQGVYFLSFENDAKQKFYEKIQFIK